MAEAVIKRTNFFDGQFLRQGEFLEMEGYHRHMRRRLQYLLFDRSGVIQRTPLDLTLEVVNPGNPASKLIRVKAGTALGKREDHFEGKEIVLRNDDTIDLNAQTPAFVAGDTAVVTIHYAEVQTDPSSEGGVTGNTRVTEQAVLTAHRNALPGLNAPNGEPYVRLGNVAYNDLALSPPRDVAYLQASLLAPSATLNSTPNQVTAGTAVTLALASTGPLDLSTLTPADVIITPAGGITALAVPARSTNSATVTFNLGATAATGPRTLSISLGGVTAQTTITVNAGLQVSGFGGVDEPAGDTIFKINGTGFVAGAQVEFSRGVGLWTTPVSVTPGNTSSGQLRIPMADIPANAVQGPVRVTSGGTTVTSTSDVTPPPVIGASPSSAVSQTNITITGSRFYTGTAVGLPGGQVRGPGSPTPFPDGAFGESLTTTNIVVRLVSAAGTASRVRVTTAGGTVQSSNTLTVT